MSKDIIVVTPNGRRQKIQCTPDTSMLQVLEDVCKKQGFKSSDYDLKYHNHIIDLTTTIRFSNVPNKATLEMVEIERKREELNVTIGLMLEDGERRMADFSPNTSLFEIISSLAPQEINMLQHPTILYMRQEVTGLPALKERTLRQLGLIKGRAILRLLNKAEEAKQANVSAVYRRPVTEMSSKKEAQTEHNSECTKNYVSDPGPSNVIKDKSHDYNPLNLIKKEKLMKENAKNDTHEIEEENMDMATEVVTATTFPEKEFKLEEKTSSTSNTSMSQDNLERRLKIEEEVTFLGTQRAIAFMQPDDAEDELEDLPDDFYDLTIEEVRKLYKDLQQQRLELENTPLLTSAKREEMTKQSSEYKLNTYKNVVVRVQFPDHMILQGVFCPTDTIGDVTNFIKQHLQDPNRPFHIFTTPLKESLDPNMTLQDAKFVPCVHMHFKWLEENMNHNNYLKEEIYSKKTSSDAAGILASKYRAPSRRKIQDNTDSSRRSSAATASTSKNSKVPKWFKN